MSDKPGLFARTKIFLGEVQVEMSKVSWPDKATLRAYTIVVLVSATIVSAVLGLYDLILSEVVKRLFGF